MRAAKNILILLVALFVFTAAADENHKIENENIVVYKLNTPQRTSSAIAAPPALIKGYKSNYLHPENIAQENTKAAGWYYIVLGNEAEASRVLKQLKKNKEVVYSYLLPKAYPAGFFSEVSSGASSSSYVDQQKYHLAAPRGFDSLFAWSFPGGNGKGVTLVDIEGDWDNRHQDLRLGKSKIRGSRAGSNSSWYPHGTAVAGIINGKNNQYGITGIAWQAKLKLNSIFRKDAGGQLYSNVSDTIYAAANRLKAGDIILIEVQFGGLENSGDYIPVEYYQDCFEAIQYAVSKGVIVVEAAANGGENLDDPIYEKRFDVDVRGDSGAIMVGAGGAHKSAYPFKSSRNNNRVKLWFSNYGKRVDLQNWGEYVVSTGYGDLSNKGKGRTYTSSFNGTSSASALTAGVCASLQGAARQILGRPLTPAEMREVLVKTGDSQRGDISGGKIGPMPNLRKAIEYLESGMVCR